MVMNKFKSALKVTFRNFNKQTTIHGINIISLPNLHICERLFWFIIITMATTGSIALTLSNWNRFLANPTVVSIQKDFRKWENIFPSATGCFDEKMDIKKAEKYIKSKWGIDPSHNKFLYYLNFVRTISNSNYHTLYRLADFQNDVTITDIDFVDLITKVHPTLSGTLVTVDRNHKPKWELILTELGVCFTINSKFAQYLSVRLNTTVNEKVTKRKLTKCHYLNGLCYARYDSDPELSLRYYIHSYLDVAHINSKSFHDVRKSEELEVNYKMMETDASPDIRYLSPSQRRCRFDDEPLTKNINMYSTSICYIICRYELVLKLCGCKPFFYHFLAGKICDINGLICLSKHTNVITQPPSNIGCKCPQPCNLITYLPQIPKYTKWDQGGYLDQRITFRWGLLHPTTKYRRNILFGFGDLVVSLGGTFNFFLGISFISIIETIYLIAEGVVIFKKINKKKESRLFIRHKGNKPKNIRNHIIPVSSEYLE